MTRMVQVTMAGDVAEADEIERILTAAGITSRLEAAVDHHGAGTEDAPQKVFVPESSLEAAQDAIESMTEPHDLTAD